MARVIARVAPDVLLLLDVDYDHDLVTLSALRDRIALGGPQYPHLFALRPNTGWPTGLDMDGDGREGRARDAQGYGRFPGQGGMALLSQLPVRTGGVRDFSRLSWRDLPGAHLPEHPDGTPFPSEAAQAAQRLASVGSWVVPFDHETGPLTVLAFHATPPVFDGPEDRNGLRNRDELRFWRLFLDGAFGSPPEARFVLMGGANNDPADGEGRKPPLRALLTDPRLQDPQPARPSPVPPQPGHAGDPRLDTVAWDGPGALRVDYVLPSADWHVVDAGVHWPPPGAPGAADARAASRHRLVWVDLAIE
ncbi:endonuclease/exonuclease/phosphatase family protein [Roseovarius salinarum]|uniref:endonuclease/exonuclease/phosphatase family protein n=1 Tax=Roseovarius salinarum TaxID=1981892 RepID=UPI001E5C3E98|nr:endonuclease/exonuclease/phosphatase family protein [Roseovarius salinarum]